MLGAHLDVPILSDPVDYGRRRREERIGCVPTDGGRGSEGGLWPGPLSLSDGKKKHHQTESRRCLFNRR